MPIAAVTPGPGEPFELVEIDITEIQPNEILVDIEATGICHTDIAAQTHALPVPMPIVLGHQGTGIVQEIGSVVQRVGVGDRVVLCSPSCGHCSYCFDGKPLYCTNAIPLAFAGGQLDGTTSFARGGAALHSHFAGQSSFATTTVALETTAVRVSADIPPEILAPLACGVQTGAGAVLNALCPEPGSSIAIFGAGAVGLSALMAAAISGCGIIILIDRVPSRLQLGQELGATHTVNFDERNPVEAVHQITGTGADYVVQAAAATKVLEDAVAAGGPGSIIASVGAGPATEAASIYPISLVNGPKTIRGIKGGERNPQVFVPLLVDEWQRHRLPIERLVRTYPFDAINQAVEDMERGEVLKPVLMMNN